MGWSSRLDEEVGRVRGGWRWRGRGGRIEVGGLLIGGNTNIVKGESAEGGKGGRERAGRKRQRDACAHLKATKGQGRPP